MACLPKPGLCLTSRRFECGEGKGRPLNAHDEHGVWRVGREGIPSKAVIPAGISDRGEGTWRSSRGGHKLMGHAHSRIGRELRFSAIKQAKPVTHDMATWPGVDDTYTPPGPWPGRVHQRVARTQLVTQGWSYLR